MDIKDIPASVLMPSGNYAYVVVKGSLHATDSAVFGLNDVETRALRKKYSYTQNEAREVINGVMLRAPPVEVVNALGQLGYKVVATTGEAEVIWTMQREV